MTIGLTILLLITAVAVASALTYTLARRAFDRDLAGLREATRQQVASLQTAVTNLEAQVAGVRKAAPEASASSGSVAAPQAATGTPHALRAHAQPKISTEDVSPETLVLIAAAITSFLGKRVRIRSAKVLQSPYEIVNPWAQQGRVIVQASHNLHLRG